MTITITGGKYSSATLSTSTLNGNVAAGDSSIVLTSGTNFATSGTITIESEEITYTGKSTNTLTGCTRGANGTTATSHTSGTTVRKGNSTDIYVTTTPFVSTDFTTDKPRRVEVYNSGGTVFRGTAFVRRWVSTSQLELESKLFDAYNKVFTTPQDGDIILVSKNFADIAQTGLVVGYGVATFTDVILFGTNSTVNGVCFHDEGYNIQFNITSAFAQILCVRGGGVSFGHIQDWESGIIYNQCTFNYGNASVFRSTNWASSTAARLYIFGGWTKNQAAGYLVYLGIAVNSNWTLSGTLFGHLWYLKHEFYSDNSIIDENVNPLAHVFEDCTYVSSGTASIPLYVGKATVSGGLFKFPNYTSAPQCWFGTSLTSGELNIGAGSGKRAVILDNGTENTLIGLANDTFKYIITNLISTDYRAGRRDGATANRPDLYSATNCTKELYWKDPYTNLKDGSVLAMIRNSDWTADSTGTASGDDSSVDMTVFYSSATGHTVFTSRGPWTSRVRKYGYDEIEYSIDKVDYSLGSAGTAYNVTFGGAQNQVPRTTLPSQSTADAVTGVTITDHGASPVSWQSKSWSITITGNKTTNPTLTASQIWAYVKSQITKTATFNGKAGYLWHVLVEENPSGSGYITQLGVSGGAGATNKGVRIVDENGDAFPDVVQMTADDGTTYTPPINYSLTLTGLVSGAKYRIEKQSDNSLLAEGTASGTTATYNYYYSSDIPVNIIVRKSSSAPKYLPYKTTGTLTDSNQSIQINLIADTIAV